jgi:tRNA(Ile)-lysidine synthase
VKGDRRQLTARHVEQVLHLATACESGHSVHLPAGVTVERSFDRLIFTLSAFAGDRQGGPGTESAAQPYEYVVELAGEGSATVSIPEIGRRFGLKRIDWPPAESDTRFQVETLDADRLRSPLILRNWRPGDSYRPRGRQRVRKLKRLLLESRVAARERKVWPVLTSAGALAWARGLPVAEEFAARAETKAGVVIAEEAL